VSATYEVFPITSAGRVCGPSVWVRSSSVGNAKKAGIEWMKVLGRKKPRFVHAQIYNPLADLEIRRFIQKAA
jgi:hypothetical protein